MALSRREFLRSVGILGLTPVVGVDTGRDFRDVFERRGLSEYIPFYEANLELHHNTGTYLFPDLMESLQIIREGRAWANLETGNLLFGWGERQAQTAVAAFEKVGRMQIDLNGTPETKDRVLAFLGTCAMVFPTLIHTAPPQITMRTDTGYAFPDRLFFLPFQTNPETATIINLHELKHNLYWNWMTAKPFMNKTDWISHLTSHIQIVQTTLTNWLQLPTETAIWEFDNGLPLLQYHPGITEERQQQRRERLQQYIRSFQIFFPEKAWQIPDTVPQWQFNQVAWYAGQRFTYLQQKEQRGESLNLFERSLLHSQVMQVLMTDLVDEVAHALVSPLTNPAGGTLAAHEGELPLNMVTYHRRLLHQSFMQLAGPEFGQLPLEAIHAAFFPEQT